MDELRWFARDVVAFVRDGMAPELALAVLLFLLIAARGLYVVNRQAR